jgi:outer membrane biosynthesis protein TonB
MNSQRKLAALLHELQHAKSPLAQARVLARSWRTLRELSPTDRRLLARHVGFDGAEEILEGLSRRKGGLAPAMLLRVLGNARSTDGSTVSQLLAAFRDPRRRDEAIALSADLASELLAEPGKDAGPEEIDEAIEQLQAVETSMIENPEEALAALTALEPDRSSDNVVGPPEPESLQQPGPAPIPEPEPKTEMTAKPGSEPGPKPKPPPPPPTVDWNHWQAATESRWSAPAPRESRRPSISDAGARRFEARAVTGSVGAEKSVLSQLLVLRRELSGFAESSADTLREAIEAFPDGWPRRRALCAMLEAGIPTDIVDALGLVSSLDRELDRRWCLALLARRGDLRGLLLSRALDLVDSDLSKRRLTAIAGLASYSSPPYILRSS